MSHIYQPRPLVARSCALAGCGVVFYATQRARYCCRDHKSRAYWAAHATEWAERRRRTVQVAAEITDA